MKKHFIFTAIILLNVSLTQASAPPEFDGENKEWENFLKDHPYCSGTREKFSPQLAPPATTSPTNSYDSWESYQANRPRISSPKPVVKFPRRKSYRDAVRPPSPTQARQQVTASLIILRRSKQKKEPRTCCSVQ